MANSELPTDLPAVLEVLREKLRALGDQPAPSELTGAALAAHLMLRLAIRRRADRLVLEAVHPGGPAPRAMLRLRVDGELSTVLESDRRLLVPLIEPWKELARCDAHVTDRPQDGRFQAEHPGLHPHEVQAVFLPGVLGESMTARLLDLAEATPLSLAHMGLPAGIQEQVDRALEAGWGLIVTSGPTGSGRGVMLHALLGKAASPTRQTVAVEDPVSVVLPWVTSVAVQARDGQTFPAALRHAMQADPDVVMIGELRDRETAQEALRIALQGTLVLTQSHATDAVQALMRLIEASGDAHAVTESVRLVLNQRLVRRLCPHCRVQGPLDAAHRGALARLAHAWGDLPAEATAPVWLARGCGQCDAGYRRRLQLTEALTLDGPIRQMLAAGGSAADLRAHLQGSGWPPLLADGLAHAQAGDTTLAEVLRALGAAA